MMGGMGREFDGSYAQYACAPLPIVFPVETDLPWEILGALTSALAELRALYRLDGQVVRNPIGQRRQRRARQRERQEDHDDTGHNR